MLTYEVWFVLFQMQTHKHVRTITHYEHMNTHQNVYEHIQNIEPVVLSLTKLTDTSPATGRVVLIKFFIKFT